MKIGDRLITSRSLGIVVTGSCDKTKIHHGDTEDTEKNSNLIKAFLRALRVSVVCF